MLANPPTDFPLRIYDLRKRLGISQTQLAEWLGVSFTTVNRWENGRHRPQRHHWRLITTLEEKHK